MNKNLYIDSSIKNLSEKEIKKICKLVIQWYCDNISQLPNGKYILLEFDYFDKDDWADSSQDGNEVTITIYLRCNKTYKHLITSILHEMVHACLGWDDYWVLHRKFGYTNHPHEIKARQIEDMYYLSCWRDIKHDILRICNSNGLRN